MSSKRSGKKTLRPLTDLELENRHLLAVHNADSDDRADLKRKVGQLEYDLATSNCGKVALNEKVKELTAEKDRQKELIEDLEEGIQEQTDALNESAAIKDGLRLEIRRLRDVVRKFQEAVSILNDR